MRMRVMTYNIQSGRDAFGRLDITGAEGEIRRLNPDICALNEVRMKTPDIGDMEQARELGERLGMRWAFAEAMPYMGGSYGIAILSRFPILESRYMLIELAPEAREPRYEPRALLLCELDVMGRRVCAYTSHYGLSEAERRAAVELTLQELRKAKDPAIFMGDLNMTPDDPLVELLNGEMREVTGELFTFGSLNLCKKIDYIYARGPLKALSATAPYSVCSDHLPLVVDLEF